MYLGLTRGIQLLCSRNKVADNGIDLSSDGQQQLAQVRAG